MKTVTVVWGLAAGSGRTKLAAPGAFTWREYENRDFPRRDWLHVISVYSDRGAPYATSK